MSILVRGVVIFIVVSVPALIGGYIASIYLNQSDSSSSGSRVTSTLKFVAVVSRHGNRAPLYGLDNFPYSGGNSTYWPFGQTGLSKKGRTEMYNVGVKLRSMYNGFLSPQYYSHEFFSTSTAVDRVLISGEALLAGLYPPKGFQKWNTTINWQPVPLHMDSLDKTQMSSMGCSRFEEEQTKVKAAFLTTYNESITNITGYVSEQLGATVSGTYGMICIWDTFYSVDTEGYTLPDWTKEVYPHPMRGIMNTMYNMYVADNDELIKLVIGPFWYVMLETMRSKVNGTLSPDRNFYFYSGHDDTIITLQGVLGINTTAMIGVVAPASTMVYELHQDETTGNFTMQVLYLNGTDSVLEPFALETPNCGDPCDFNLLVQNTEKYYVTDYSKECSTSNTPAKALHI